MGAFDASLGPQYFLDLHDSPFIPAIVGLTLTPLRHLVPAS